MAFRGIDYVLALKLGDGYTGFYFIMIYTVWKQPSWDLLPLFRIAQLVPWTWNIPLYGI